MEGCCVGVFIVVFVVLVIVFGTMILSIAVAIFNVIYLILLDVSAGISRVLWKIRISGLSYSELSHELKSLSSELHSLKGTNSKLSAKVFPKGFEIEAMQHDLVLDKNKTRLADVEKRIGILKILTKEQEGEHQLRRQQQLSDFTNDSDYQLIRRFAEKYGADYEHENLSQLLKLLDIKGHKLESSELKTLISTEQKNIRIEHAKSKILENNPATKEEFLRSYLKTYKSDDVELIALESLLKESNLMNDNSAHLQADLDSIVEKIRTEEFEKGLLE